ncbi:DUF3152 domain-containing protein [Corynebacterium provencense]|uniref:DUF3152 domain-containing protein n=1 Tax=Corynebacterium provencense TaxID=1737425 RepID=UPI0008358277|nr:DUF3152 domain-containing protein [Corynebacterium provencense]
MGALIVVLVTVGVLVDVFTGGSSPDSGDRQDVVASSPAGEDAAPQDAASAGPLAGAPVSHLIDKIRNPHVRSEKMLAGAPVSDTVGELPPGGDYTRSGAGRWHGVGTPGAVAGDPGRAGVRTVTYVVEVEDGTDTSSFGGGDAFASMVDATLADPRSWTAETDDPVVFRHVSVSDAGAPDLRIRLTTPETTRTLCGGEIRLETSCFVGGGDASGEMSGAAGEGRVIINLARWVRGALPFQGDVGSYRQYVVNHEVGHGLGHAAHRPCPADGDLAPVMMQQTLSLANRDLAELDAGSEYTDDAGDIDAVCRANPWPRPDGGTASSH